jgi:hypothetical protein
MVPLYILVEHHSHYTPTVNFIFEIHSLISILQVRFDESLSCTRYSI